jgi:hypothetical protein
VKAAILFVLMTAPANGAAGSPADAVDAYRCGAQDRPANVNVGEASRAYAERSVALVMAAQAGDTDVLGKMVAPGATFTVFHGDVGIGPRSKGVGAAIEFTRQVAPTHYSVNAGSAGPVSVDPCGRTTVEMTMRSKQAGKATVARFTYDHGQLMEVTGSSVDVIEGDIP